MLTEMFTQPMCWQFEGTRRLKYLIPVYRKDAAESSLPGYAIVYFSIDSNVSEDTAASIFKAEETEASSKSKDSLCEWSISASQFSFNLYTVHF